MRVQPVISSKELDYEWLRLDAFTSPDEVIRAKASWEDCLRSTRLAGPNTVPYIMWRQNNLHHFTDRTGGLAKLLSEQ
jgi:hypothetical protein